MIPLEWIRMFGTTELQLLLSGDQRRIDIAGNVLCCFAMLLVCYVFRCSQVFFTVTWRLSCVQCGVSKISTLLLNISLTISRLIHTISTTDMQANVHYGSGYHPSQPYVQAFWSIVENMQPEDQVHSYTCIV